MQTRTTEDLIHELASFSGNKTRISQHIYQTILDEQNIESITKLVEFINATLVTKKTVISIGPADDKSMISRNMLHTMKDAASDVLMLNDCVCHKDNINQMEIYLDNIIATLEGEQTIKRFLAFLKTCSNNSLTQLIAKKCREALNRPNMSDNALRVYLCASKRSEETKLNFLKHWYIGFDAVVGKIDNITKSISVELEKNHQAASVTKTSTGVVQLGLYQPNNQVAELRATDLHHTYQHLMTYKTSLQALEESEVTSFSRMMK